MRAVKGSVLPYKPEPVPTDLPASARTYLDNELNRIAALLGLLVNGLHLDPTYAAPTKPMPGDVVYADGARWNPGSGEGIYYYKSTGVWALLG